ncbi:CYTH domain-containing protein [Agrobacterium sp. a22-2]|uniref:CYTH domain-containing protein n=1 Tax=Agrobacterium sp. a22-2 TaxID=2283840 RepID=UPI001447FBA0|nr:CYTH domain-containing protein [Agrobacterium sp. a22-2]NKN35427.1 CYTH domain-containing protein [Agrobacterium sp. a22-2]
MAKEIERKFLVLNDDWRPLATSSTPMRQAYIASMDDRSVRVRTRNGTSAMLTIKIGQSQLVRDEFEYPIPLTDAEELMTMAIGRVIEKTRHTVENGGFIWEVDVFEGAYQGLVIAEVEMRSETDDPARPAWLGAEITGDRRYSNQSLAIETSPTEFKNGLSH